MPAHLLQRIAAGRLAVALVLSIVATVIVTKADEFDIGCDSDAYNFPAYGFPALQKKYEKSIVLISCEAELPEIKSIGTGFLIDSKLGLFLTARHVIRDDKNNDYNCVPGGKPIFAYAMGDMCERTELEFVEENAKLDVALLRVKTANNSTAADHAFANRAHFELLSRGMRTTEKLEMIGFGSLVGVLKNANPGSPALQKLPASAGGHTCDGRPQPYKYNPLDIDHQKIDGKSPNHLRGASDIRKGDSGAPLFLADGRVAGIVTKVSFGEFSAGTEVTSASDISNWLVSVLASREKSIHEIYSIEAWTRNNKLFDALNPDICFPSNSCLSNVQIAVQLQRIATNAVSVGSLTAGQKKLLRCPLYAAAETRDIYPQYERLRRKLDEAGIKLARLPGYLAIGEAKLISASTKFTTYTKIAAYDRAETYLATDLAETLIKAPNAIASTFCNSGVDAGLTTSVAHMLDDYLVSRGATTVLANTSQFIGCPSISSNPAQTNRVKALTKLIADVKLSLANLVKSGDAENSLAPAPAVALAAFFNFGDKKGANALIDLGDTYINEKPDLAAAAYAKAYKDFPNSRALAGFGVAIQRSPKLQATAMSTAELRKFIESDKFVTDLPNINQAFIAKTVVDGGNFSKGM